MLFWKLKKIIYLFLNVGTYFSFQFEYNLLNVIKFATTVPLSHTATAQEPEPFTGPGRLLLHNTGDNKNF